MKESFVKIPHALLRKDLKSNEVYLLAKLAMLEKSNLHYDLKTTGSVRFVNEDGTVSSKKEMSKTTVEKIVKHLEALSYLKISKLYKETGTHPFNNYKTNLDSYLRYESVKHNYLNLTSLSADAKGFGIQLALLGGIPSSANLISGLIQIDAKTVRKYLKELTDAGVIENNQLSYKYFPDNWYPKYESKKAELLFCDGNSDFIKVIDWIERKMFEKSQYEKYDCYNAFRWGLSQLYALEQGKFQSKPDDSYTYKEAIML